MLSTIWNRQTGEARHCDSVDAKEILALAPDLYTAVDPDAAGTAAATAAVPATISAADEYRREPVGINPPETPLAGEMLRNPTGTPRLGVPTPHDHFVRSK